MLYLTMNTENSFKNKVQCDPGWNDPPLYSYDSLNSPAQSNTNKKVNILNKRVAYPMGHPKVTSGGMNPTLPPTNSPVPLPPSCALLSGDVNTQSLLTTKDEIPVDKEETLSRVKEIFKQILDKNDEIQQGSDEINRRLTTMFKMWEDDRFNPGIHRRLLELAEALKAGDFDRADHLHVGLAVDYPSLCASWIPGIRRIAQHLKLSNQSNEPIDEEGFSEPLPHVDGSDE